MVTKMKCEVCNNKMERIRTNLVVQGVHNIAFTVNLYKCSKCENSILPLGEQKRIKRRYDLVDKGGAK